MSTAKTSIRFFDDRPVRSVWDDETAVWWTCASDVYHGYFSPSTDRHRKNKRNEKPMGYYGNKILLYSFHSLSPPYDVFSFIMYAFNLILYKEMTEGFGRIGISRSPETGGTYPFVRSADTYWKKWRSRKISG